MKWDEKRKGEIEYRFYSPDNFSLRFGWWTYGPDGPKRVSDSYCPNNKSIVWLYQKFLSPGPHWWANQRPTDEWTDWPTYWYINTITISLRLRDYWLVYPYLFLPNYSCMLLLLPRYLEMRWFYLYIVAHPKSMFMFHIGIFFFLLFMFFRIKRFNSFCNASLVRFFLLMNWLTNSSGYWTCMRLDSNCIFSVADTQLCTLPCRSVRPSLRRLVP